MAISHPLVHRRTLAAGRSEACLAGTRILVRQVTAQVRDAGGDINEVADYLDIDPSLVDAALDYYAEFRTAIDADAQWAAVVEAREHARYIALCTPARTPEMLRREGE